MSIENSELGWYQIDEVWDLWIDNELTDVTVGFIEIQETPESNEYRVSHYDNTGEFLTEVTLPGEDIRPEIEGRSNCGNPIGE